MCTHTHTHTHMHTHTHTHTLHLPHHHNPDLVLTISSNCAFMTAQICCDSALTLLKVFVIMAISKFTRIILAVIK